MFLGTNVQKQGTACKDGGGPRNLMLHSPETPGYWGQGQIPSRILWCSNWRIMSEVTLGYGFGLSFALYQQELLSLFLKKPFPDLKVEWFWPFELEFWIINKNLMWNLFIIILTLWKSECKYLVHIWLNLRNGTSEALLCLVNSWGSGSVL